MRFVTQWVDRGREPQNPPNPAFPDGIDVDLSDIQNKDETCLVKLAYPAKRCGLWWVKCEVCGMSVILTTAGRRDDPRSVRLACQKRKPDA